MLQERVLADPPLDWRGPDVANDMGPQPDTAERAYDHRLNELLRGWGLFGPETSLDHDGVGRVLAEGRHPRPTAVVPPQALAAAVADSRGQVRAADPRFRAWFGDSMESPGILGLLRSAQHAGLALGLLEAGDGGVMAVCAGRSAAFERWVLPPEQARLREGAGSALFIVAFAPSRCSELALRASRGFGLSELEARVAEAMLGAPSLKVAAAQIGIGAETARDALSGAMRKMGVDRSAALVRRMTALMCASPPCAPDEADAEDETALMARVMGLTRSEARIVALMSPGCSASELAQVSGSTEFTVKSHLKAIYRKTGVRRSRDLERLALEVRELHRLASSEGVVAAPAAPEGTLRIIAVEGARQVAFIDYGPASGRVLFCGHGLFSGRTLPPAYVAALQRRGARPIVQHRPGFGLSHPAPAARYLETAADDMAAILDALRRPKADAVGRDCGAPALLAFAQRHPDRLEHGVLMNPRGSREAEAVHPMPLAGLSRLFLRRPELIGLFTDAMRRRLSFDTVERTMTRVLYAPSDLAVVDAPAVRERLTADVMGLVAQTSAGPIQEQAVYPEGWRAPVIVGGRSWTVVTCDELEPRAPDRQWAHFPGVAHRRLAEGGFLMPFSHPEALAAAVLG